MAPLPENNKWATFKPRDVRNVNLILKPQEDETLTEQLKSLCDDQLKFDKKLSAYVLKRSDIGEFIEALDEVAAHAHDEQGSDDEHDSSEDDESSEDDATIQLVLTKNLKHKSAGEIITETNVSDSELEESISLSRRLRHVYAKLAEMEKRIAALEKH